MKAGNGRQVRHCRTTSSWRCTFTEATDRADSCHLDSSLEDGNVFSTIIGSGDFNGDGKSDVLAGGADATLRMYPGNGTGGFRSRKAVAAGRNIFSTVLR
jgi:hypothetical protein